MVSIKKELVVQLNSIGLPVYFEEFFNEKTPIPCITYCEINNTDSLVGDTIEYSDIVMQVKVWSPRVSFLDDNAILIDEKMKELGFRRHFGKQMFTEGLGQYILKYKAKGFKNT